jgi:hemoglobin/transferrin/lactoferrin receptor protein
MSAKRVEIVRSASSALHGSDCLAGIAMAGQSATGPQPRASGKVSRSNRFSAVVHNLTDRMHLEWTNVRGIAANSPVLDSSTAPGRSVPVALVHDF